MAPQAGPHNPVVDLPLAAGAVRRTTVVDTAWADWSTGRTRVALRASDSTGESAALDLEVELAMGEVLSASDPALVGATVRAGFGRFLAATFPAEAEARTLRFSVLDDLAGAFFVSGYAPLREGLYVVAPDQVEEAAARQGDVCIGWAKEHSMYVTLVTTGVNSVPYGPPAPVLAEDVPLGPRDMRRRRTVDVAPRTDGGVDVVSHLRDTYEADDGEMVLHEWLVSAVVSEAGVFTSVAAEARTLPWTECPGAAASALGIVGTSLSDLGAKVRRDLVGTVTCTHLTSTLRALADVQALQALTQPRGSGIGRSA